MWNGALGTVTEDAGACGLALYVWLRGDNCFLIPNMPKGENKDECTVCVLC